MVSVLAGSSSGGDNAISKRWSTTHCYVVNDRAMMSCVNCSGNLWLVLQTGHDCVTYTYTHTHTHTNIHCKKMITLRKSRPLPMRCGVEREHTFDPEFNVSMQLNWSLGMYWSVTAAQKLASGPGGPRSSSWRHVTWIHVLQRKWVHGGIACSWDCRCDTFRSSQCPKGNFSHLFTVPFQ